MNSIIYLTQVTACSAVFYLFYYLFLRKLTFFSINRWYLLSTVILSFLIPLIKIDINQPKPYTGVVEQVVYTYVPPQAEPPVFIPAPKQVVKTEPFTWRDVLRMSYYAAVAGLSIQLLITLVAFYTRLKGKRITKLGNVNILSGNNKISNGSFLNYIFVNEDELSADEIQQIIAHEMMHVRLYHSADRIIVKLAQIVLWFNPFIYMYARSVEENHEFEVDRAVANNTDKHNYANLLLHLSVAGNGMLYHNFSKVPLKKRITMLFIKPTTNMKKVIYLLFVPVVLISTLAFASLKKNASENNAIDKSKKISKPNFPKAIEDLKKTDYYKRSHAFVGKIIKVSVKDMEYDNGKLGGLMVTYDRYRYIIAENNLSKVKVGDELSVKVSGFIITFESIGKGIDQRIALPMQLKPEFIYKNGKKIFTKKDDETSGKATSVDNVAVAPIPENSGRSVAIPATKTSYENLKAIVIAQSNKRTLKELYSRKALDATTDEVKIKFSNGAELSTKIRHKAKVGFYINNAIYNEGQLKDFLEETVAGRPAGVTNAATFKKYFGADLKVDIKGYETIFYFNKDLSAPADTSKKKENKLGSIKATDKAKDQRVIITSDSMAVKTADHINEYFGNVKFSYNGMVLTAGYVRLDDAKKMIFASGRWTGTDAPFNGRPIVKMGKDDTQIVSDSILVNYQTKSAHVWNSSSPVKK